MDKYTLEKIDISENSINKWMDLFKSCFNLRPEYTIDWAYWYNNSSYKKNELYVIKDLDKVVASYGLFPLNIVYKNKNNKSYLANNGMTHPEYGNNGFFTKLGKHIMENIRTKDVILMGIPNDNAIPGHRKVGWQELNNIPFFEITDVKVKYELKNEYTFVDKFSNEDDIKIKQFLSKYDFYIDKDSNYLNWRFIDRPNINYLIFKSSPFNNFIVLKHFKYKDENKLHIVDFGYNQIEDFIDIIKLSINKGYELGVDIINIWCYNKQEQEILTTLKFNKSELSSRFILHSDIDFLKADTSKWHVTLGDNDVF